MAIGGSYTDQLTVIQRSNSKILWKFKAPDSDLPRPAEHWGMAVAFSPDSSKLAVGGTEEQIYLLDAASGTLIGKKPHEDLIANLAFSFDGRWVIASGCSENPGITTWDIVQDITHRYDVSACNISASPTQPIVAIGGVDPRTQILDLPHSQLKVLNSLNNGELNLAFSPDGKTIAGEQGPELQFVDVASDSPLAILPWQTYQSDVDWVAWSPNNHLATFSADGKIAIWDITQRALIARQDSGPTGVLGTVWSPDGADLAILTEFKITIWHIG